MLPAERLIANLIGAGVWGLNTWLLLRFFDRVNAALLGVIGAMLVIVIFALADDVGYWRDLDHELFAKTAVVGVGVIVLINLVCINLFP